MPSTCFFRKSSKLEWDTFRDMVDRETDVAQLTVMGDYIAARIGAVFRIKRRATNRSLCFGREGCRISFTRASGSEVFHGTLVKAYTDHAVVDTQTCETDAEIQRHYVPYEHMNGLHVGDSGD